MAEKPLRQTCSGRTASSPAAGKGAGTAAVLARLGLQRAEELLLHLPLRYEDETRLTPIARLLHGSAAQIQGRVLKAEVTGGRARRALQVQVADDSGELQLRFLHFYPSQLAQLTPGKLVRAFGELRVGLFGREMVHPRYRIVNEDTPLPDRLTPIYPTVAGLGQSVLRREIDRALAAHHWTDTLPADWLARQACRGCPHWPRPCGSSIIRRPAPICRR